MERHAVAYAAREVCSPGDTLILVHAAPVLPPQTSVLHAGGPQTTWSAGGDVDMQELHAKVTKAVRSK